MSRYARNAAVRASGADKNTSAIREAYEKGGASVAVLTGVGGGCPDLLVGFRGVDKLREVKRLPVPGVVKPSDAALRDSQEKFIRTWRGAAVLVVRTPEQALADLRTWTAETDRLRWELDGAKMRGET